MDFSLNEEQEAVRDLAARIFQGQASTARVKEVEGSADRVDLVLWSKLAGANLLGVGLPEDVGGSGFGLIELCLLLEQQGRRVAPVPLWPTLVLGALPLARFGTEQQRAEWLPGVAGGDIFLTAALEDASAVAADEGRGGWRLTGTKLSVPGAHVAARVLVPAGDRVFLVDPSGPGVECQRAEATNREILCHLHLDGAPGEALGGPGEVLSWLRPRALTGLCALQVGVTEEALALAASYSSGRIQFGRPLSTFQGAALKAADAYIATEAIRVTMWQAAWRLAEGHPADREVEVAKWWASEAGQKVVHITQHLHGGMGADVEYPVHRYFLWGKQIEVTLGGASKHLADLGTVLATGRP